MKTKTNMKALGACPECKAGQINVHVGVVTFEAVDGKGVSGRGRRVERFLSCNRCEWAATTQEVLET